jgi:CheY-like chemotaxis protein
VLVVDDEADARGLLRHLLESCSATVMEAGSAEAAVDLLKDPGPRPDVIVSDVGMPGENGYTMLARIRALDDARTRAIPAVALTAYARAEDRVAALRAGFQMHVPKPVEPAELVVTLASLIGRPKA